MALLAASTKSGELRVVGSHVEGRLWLRRGQLVASTVGKTHDHVEALFELLRLTEGNFVFRDGVDPPEPADPTPPAEPVEVDPVLRQAQDRLAEWKDIIEVVPSVEHRVRLIAELPAPEVTLSAQDWQMVMAVALAGSVQGVLEELHAGEFDGFRGIRRMVDAGLVVIEPPRVRTIGPRPSRRLPDPVAPAPESVVEEPPVEPVVQPEADGEPDAVVVHGPPEPHFPVLLEGHDEPEESAADAAAAGGAAAAGDAINRGLLLKFLSSVRS